MGIHQTNISRYFTNIKSDNNVSLVLCKWEPAKYIQSVQRGIPLFSNNIKNTIIRYAIGPF